MFCSEKQLEALFKLHSKRELSDKMRVAVRHHNNGGWNYVMSAAKAGVSEDATRLAVKRLKRAHAIIIEGYASRI